MADPQISVITPSYQQGRFLERTIQSVLGQDIDGLEYLVMDGGSSDESVSILERYGERLWWRSEPDGGQAAAVNDGLDRARGAIIGWLNSDDVYYAGALRKVLAFFDEHRQVDVVYGDADHIDEDDGWLERYPTEPWDPERLQDTCFLCQPAVFFRRRAIERWGALDPELNFCMDYELWLRLAAGGARFAYLRQRLAGSRLYAENKTLGQRVAAHAEINRMTRRSLGRVPDRWLVNWATEVQRRWGWGGEGSRGHYRGVALASWAAARYWNRELTTEHRQRLTDWWRADGEPTEVASPRAAAAHRKSESLASVGRNGHSGLRIGFDVSQTGPGKSGCGWFADTLLDGALALRDDVTWLLYRSFGDHYWEASGPPPVDRFLRPNVREGTFHRSAAEMRDFWRQPPADFERQLGAPDIVHANNFFAPHGLEQARLVYTLYDLIFLNTPDMTSEANRLACSAGVMAATQQADLVVAISEASRQEFLDAFPGYPEDRTTVVYPSNRFAARLSAGEDAEGVPDSALEAVPTQLAAVEERLARGEFWLSVGERGPRKNRDRVLQAFARYLGQASRARTLARVGGGAARDPELDRQIAALGLSGRVVRLDYVDDAALAWLYANAFALIFASLAEGFGMPLVEAMGFGTPVVASDLTIFHEVAREAFVPVAPKDPEAISAGMERLAGDPKLHRAVNALGRLRARRYTPERSGAALLAAYEDILERPKYRGAGRRIGDPVPMAGLD
ncbi:MAG: glycosyltransferase [Acidobacteriota bacterium]